MGKIWENAKLEVVAEKAPQADGESIQTRTDSLSSMSDKGDEMRTMLEEDELLKSPRRKLRIS